MLFGKKPCSSLIPFAILGAHFSYPLSIYYVKNISPQRLRAHLCGVPPQMHSPYNQAGEIQGRSPGSWINWTNPPSQNLRFQWLLRIASTHLQLRGQLWLLPYSLLIALPKYGIAHQVVVTVHKKVMRSILFFFLSRQFIYSRLISRTFLQSRIIALQIN